MPRASDRTDLPYETDQALAGFHQYVRDVCDGGFRTLYSLYDFGDKEEGPVPEHPVRRGRPRGRRRGGPDRGGALLVPGGGEISIGADEVEEGDLAGG